MGSFGRYVDLVRTNPLLPSYTHSLRVRQTSYAEGHTTWPTLVPVLLGRLLVALQELEFACPLPCPHPSFFTSVSQLQTVTFLSISGPIDITFSGFVRMILSFPSLTHLRSNLDGIRGWKDPIVVPKRAMSQLHLSVLEIHDIDGHISEFVQWILTTTSPASLTTLWFEFNDELELKALGHLINRCESLRKLTLSLISGCPLSPIGASKSIYITLVADIQICVWTIEFLSFRGNLCLEDLCYPEVAVGNLSSCLLNVLSTITQPSLRTLSIKLSTMDTIPFDAPADASFSAIGWEILDTALSAPVFANLRRVNLAYLLTPTMTIGTMSDSILAQKLPSLTSRRILDTRRTAYPNEW